MEAHPVLLGEVRWRAVGSAVFTRAAFVGGSWWVPRFNDFPEHPMFTLFAGGRRTADIDDLPANWRAAGTREPLAPGERQQVLDVMLGLGPVAAD